MNTVTLLFFFIVAAVYVLEPEFFRYLPEIVNIERQILGLNVRTYFLKRKIKRQLKRDIKRMKKDMEEFTKKKEGVK